MLSRFGRPLAGLTAIALVALASLLGSAAVATNTEPPRPSGSTTCPATVTIVAGEPLPNCEFKISATGPAAPVNGLMTVGSQPDHSFSYDFVGFGSLSAPTSAFAPVTTAGTYSLGVWFEPQQGTPGQPGSVTSQLIVLPGEPHRIEAADVHAIAGESFEITARVFDAYDNMLEGVPVSASLTSQGSGHLENLRRHISKEGLYAIDLRVVGSPGVTATISATISLPDPLVEPLISMVSEEDIALFTGSAAPRFHPMIQRATNQQFLHGSVRVVTERDQISETLDGLTDATYTPLISSSLAAGTYERSITFTPTAGTAYAPASRGYVMTVIDPSEARLTTSAAPSPVIAGAPATVSTRIETQTGIPVTGATATLSSEAGAVDGDTVTFLTAGEHTVTATLDADPTVTTSTTVTVAPAGPADLELATTSGSWTVDQGGSLDFEVSGTDAYGNAVTIDPSSVLLTSSVPTDQISGTTVTFPTASPHTITATVGALTASITVQVTPNPPAALPPHLMLSATGWNGSALATASLLLVAAGLLLRFASRQRATQSP